LLLGLDAVVARSGYQSLHLSDGLYGQNVR
jgi:hypothetical protein